MDHTESDTTRPDDDGTDLVETLRTTGAARQFTDEPVDDEVLARLLDTARFAPNGGNRQAWRVVVVADPVLRRGLRDLYLTPWAEYAAQGAAGLTPWPPVGDREAEAAAVASVAPIDPDSGDHALVDGLFAAPVVLALFADLTRLVGTDRDLGRYTLVAGASIYPFAWSILLGARAEGLGGVMTTILTRQEALVRDLLGAPDHFALAAVLMLGHPVRQPRKLRREPVASFATLDRFDGPPFGA
jgi:nitroreductase